MRTGKNPSTAEFTESFSQRELQILSLLAREYSNQEIASQLSLALNSVKWYLQQIFDKLAVKNRRAAVRRAHELGLVQEVPLSQPVIQPPPHNIPAALTSFIGRECETAEVLRLIEANRLVTLTGAGGTGKTRLALRAAEALKQYPDGAWLVELASLADPDLVPQAVAAALGLQKTGEASYQSMLSHSLQEKHLLLILDNCEHLLDACAGLAAALLQRCARVTILATSRERLATAGEQVYPVPPLTALDPDEVAEIHELERTDSIRLFAERAAAILPGFRLTRETLPTAARICHRLDGIPLAIELAAARMSALSLEQIAARLDDRFRLLTGGSRTSLPRQQTLRASIEWSYSLLTEPERLLFQRLSVFSGGWTLEAAEKVCALAGLEAGEILDALISLEKKSLITAETLSGAQARYHMLETIRQYARERLGEAGREDAGLETASAASGVGLLRSPLEAAGTASGAVTPLDAALRDRHLAFFLSQARQYGPRLKTRQVTGTLPLIDAELDNLRGAITWALGKGDRPGVEDALGILTALDDYWSIRALYWETFPRFQQALERLPAGGPVSAEWKAWGLYILARLRSDIQYDVETLGFLNQSISLFRQAENGQGLALALALRSFVTFMHAFFATPDPAVRLADARRDQAESFAIARDLAPLPGDEIQRALAWVDCWNGMGEVFRGYLAEGKAPGQPGPVFHRHLAEGRVLGKQSQGRFRQLGDRYGELYGGVVWLYASLNSGGGPELLPDIEQALELAKRLNHKRHQCHCYEMMARIYLDLGRHAEFEANVNRVILLHQQVGSVRGEITQHIWLGDYYTNRQDYPSALAHVRLALDRLSDAAIQKDIFLTLDTLIVAARLALHIDQPRRAAALLGFSERSLEGYSQEPWGFDRQRFEQCRQTAWAALGEVEYQTACREGREMTLEQAVELALALDGKGGFT